MSKQNIFLRDGELWLIQGEVPKRPDPVYCDFPSREATEEEITRSAFKNHWPEYRESIARLKKEAIKVDLPKVDVYLIDKYGDGTWILHKGEDRGVTMKEGEIFQVDAEVEIQHDCKDCGLIPDGTCKKSTPCDFRMPTKMPPNSMVAILKPVKQEQPEDNQDKLWKEAESLADQILPDEDIQPDEVIGFIRILKSKFHIIRK